MQKRKPNQMESNARVVQSGIYRANSRITLLRHRAQGKGREKAGPAKELVEKAIEK